MLVHPSQDRRRFRTSSISSVDTIRPTTRSSSPTPINLHNDSCISFPSIDSSPDGVLSPLLSTTSEVEIPIMDLSDPLSLSAPPPADLSLEIHPLIIHHPDHGQNKAALELWDDNRSCVMWNAELRLKFSSTDVKHSDLCLTRITLMPVECPTLKDFFGTSFDIGDLRRSISWGKGKPKFGPSWEVKTGIDEKNEKYWREAIEIPIPLAKLSRMEMWKFELLVEVELLADVGRGRKDIVCVRQKSSFCVSLLSSQAFGVNRF